MDQRVFIRIDDDDLLGHTQRFADELRQVGLAVSDVSPVVGQITGTVDPAGLASLRQRVAALGLRLVADDAEAVHRLPPEGVDLQ